MQSVMEGRRRILVIDDELAIRRLLRVILAAHGYELLEASTGSEGLMLASSANPELILLDLGLPDTDGLELLERLREFLATPIVVLSVKEHEAVKIRSLDLGADDYVTKPFSSGELMARIRVALRHRQPLPDADNPCLQFGRLMVNLALRTVEVNGQPIHLTPLEYDLLRTLVLHAGRVLTHRQLIQAVWGSSYSQTDGQYLRVHIANLRKKIEEDVTRPTLLMTEPGIGYRFAALDELPSKDFS
ncbi:MAG: response regulator [Alicyclobacillaceae bacterium]|uniref:response regulator n=1 Tax=Alicyclobacillus sp. SP_1 TaxID=2942475 RepID=UPI002157478B|nr:response regulator [Alicyclobacillus sp. SP_1]MCY0888887.1 response regulator [Alicyclobacillaceae bacterium]MCY0896305.1 response regulator [Alicyclobacillaceae bacterium]